MEIGDLFFLTVKLFELLKKTAYSLIKILNIPFF